jgi:RNA 2',3'-cyclic 3'-phosphodiesterase
LRAFIAIDLPQTIQAALGQAQAAFRAPCPDCRWTRPEGIHLTLKFLGPISDDQVREVTTALAALGPFEKLSVHVTGFGFFPDERRPRVFWAGLEAPPALEELAKRVENAMNKLGFPREERPFAPHLTLARFKTPRAQPRLKALFEKQVGQSLGRFEVSEFFLFESKLSPHGAEYRKVVRFPCL